MKKIILWNMLVITCTIILCLSCYALGTNIFSLNIENQNDVKVFDEINFEMLNTIKMRYDDRLDISNKTVEVLNPGTPQSYKVGFGITSEILDDSVIRIENNTLIASGIGEAFLLIDGQYTCINVEPAPISLLLLIGQSNMQGSEGDGKQSIVCPDGLVYATYGDRYTMTTKNAKKYAPSALTGDLASINVTGDTEYLSSYPVYSLNEKGVGKPGPDSGIAYSWVKESGEKVWVVNAAHGGSSITTWQKTGDNYKEAVLLFSSCEETLKQEIKAGHFTLSHLGYFWLQGCTDEKQTAQWYYDRFLAMHENLKKDLAFDHDSNPNTPNITFEFGDIMLAMAGHSGSNLGYRSGIYEDKSSTFFSTFLELEMRGHRVAQHYLAASQEYPDINMVCTIGETWLTMPDGTSGVKSYFEEHYENGRVDYTVQVKQNDAWYKPTKALDVKDTIHYNQIGYNEIGIEAARNALILLGVKEDTDEETKVEFVNWTGYKQVNEIQGSLTGMSSTLVVPIVTPCYRAKEVTYTLSDGLSYYLFDLLTNDITKSGKLTASTGEYVEVVPSEPCTYLWRDDGTGLISIGEDEGTLNSLTKKAGTIKDGIYSQVSYALSTPIKLIHNLPWVIEFKCSGTFTGMLFSSTGQTSTGQEYIFKTATNSGLFAFGTYNGSTYLNYGAMSNNMDDEYHIYHIENRINNDGTNMAYFYIDGIEIGCMNNYFIGGSNNKNTKVDWINGRDFVFSYIGTTIHPINNCKIKYISVFEDSSGYDVHTHDFTEWEIIQMPNENLSGKDSRTCLDCGVVETRTYDGVYKTCDLGKHLNILPKSICKGKNIWKMFDHDKYYYYPPQATWAIHNTGKVFSVTININPGDKIYATSFGKSSENGRNGIASGIRVTFFDIHGVLVSYQPSQVYSEFSKNGYITAPKGSYAVCIPMWTNSNENELYILSYDHNYDNGTINKEPTCTLEGEMIYTCHLCGYNQTEKIEALGHNYGIFVTKPTCTEQGYTTYKCSRCTDSYSDFYVNALGHDYSKIWISEDSNTHCCLCTRCNNSKLVENHKWNEGIIKTKPTYTHYGEIEYTCSVCSMIKTNYNKIDIDIPGDFNNDGKINNKDLFKMFKYLSNIDIVEDENVLDLNLDGKTNNKDLTVLFKYLSGIDAEMPFINIDMYELRNILKDNQLSVPNGIIFECDNLQYYIRNNNFIYFIKDKIDYSEYRELTFTNGIKIYFNCDYNDIKAVINVLNNSDNKFSIVE